MPDDVFGFNSQDIVRIRKALEFIESFQRKPDMRRTNLPATVYGLDYIYGTLAADLALGASAELTVDSPIDEALEDSETSVQVFGRWFSAVSGDEVGATWNPFTETWDVDRKVCEDEPDADNEDGGNAAGGGDTEDGGTPDTGGGDLDGGTP